MDINKRNNIKNVRKARKLSQKKLAELMGTTQQVISLYESGKRVPSDPSFLKLAKILDVDSEYLKGDVYSENEVLEALNNVYLYADFSDIPDDKRLKLLILLYIEINNLDKPENIFNINQLKALDEYVKEYWLNNFGFVVKKQFSYLKKRDKEYPINENIPHAESILISNLVDILNNYFNSLNYKYTYLTLYYKHGGIHDKIWDYLFNIDLMLKFGTKEEIATFNNELISAIKKFAKDIKKLPDNQDHKFKQKGK